MPSLNFGMLVPGAKKVSPSTGVRKAMFQPIPMASAIKRVEPRAYRTIGRISFSGLGNLGISDFSSVDIGEQGVKLDPDSGNEI